MATKAQKSLWRFNEDDSKTIIAAIDIGTSFSGWAYASRSDLDRNANIYVKPWYSTYNAGSTGKTSTCALIRPDGKTLDSFGFEAERKYEELVSKKQHEPYYFFKNFKTGLYGKYDQAGLLSNSIIIALEPEAAAIYCRQLEVCAANRQSGVKLSSLEIGSKYLVLDAGGGTIDLTMHEIASSECVKQVVAATGNIYGGNEVNKAFENYVRRALPVEMYDKFRRKETEDWLELMGDFETKKKAFDLKQNTVNIRCPRGLQEIYKSKTQNSIFKRLKKRKSLEEAFRGLDIDVTLNRDRIIFPSHVFSMLFQPAIDKAIKEIKKVIRNVYGETISCILMVGGFSECILLQQAVMSEFPYIPVVVPVEAATAVLKGAVLYGYHPPVISERVAKYTYGVSACVKFIPGAHPIEKREVTDEGVVCKDIFKKHVTRGEVVKTGESQHSVQYFPSYRKQKFVSWNICASKLQNPMYTTDRDCYVIGKVTLELSDTDDARNNQLNVTFAFGGTEIIVTAKESKTGRKFKTKTIFLE